MRYEEMTQQTKDVFNAVLANSLSYPIENKMIEVEITADKISISSQDTMHRMVVKSVVEVTEVFGLGFWVDCEKKDIVIKIY